MPAALRPAEAEREEGGPPQGRPEPLKTYVISCSDGNTYEVEADAYEIVDGALEFVDERDRSVITYGPGFWSVLSIKKDPL